MSLPNKQAGTAYYIDSFTGADTNSGASPKNAWKTLQRINQEILNPGSKVLFKAGTSYTGQLKPQGSGESSPINGKSNPIVIGKYGSGKNPRIDAEGKFQATLYLYNVQGYEISDLEITNTGPTDEPKRYGVFVQIQDFGKASHIWLKRLYVHDVNGSLVKNKGGGGAIVWQNGGQAKPSSYYDLLIEGCHVQRTQRNGIIGISDYWARDKWNPSRKVVIRNNLIEEIPGDAIVPIGCDGALVEHNVCRNFTRLLPDGEAAAGIWPWGCDNTLIQYNEVSGHKAPWDAQGFDSDYACQNTTIQYNYSHDNEGGFLLICNDGNSKMPWNIGCDNSVIRYNVSVNDGLRATGKNAGFSPTFHLSGPITNTKVYNNTIIIKAKPDPKIDRTLIKFDNWGGAWPLNTLLSNNIFYVEGETQFIWGGAKTFTFTNNLYFGQFAAAPEETNTLHADPQFIDLNAPKDGFKSLAGLMLRKSSPAIGKGLPAEIGPWRDILGHPLPHDKPLCIGALDNGN